MASIASGLDSIMDAGFSLYACAFSAIDSYLGRESLPYVFLQTDAGVADLVRILGDAFDGAEIRFPGVSLADLALGAQGLTWYFRCNDDDDDAEIEKHCNLSLSQPPGFFGANSWEIGPKPDFPVESRAVVPKSDILKQPHLYRSFRLLSFYQDLYTGHFHDPEGVYPFLLSLKKERFSVQADCAGAAPGLERFRLLLDAALICARYNGPYRTLEKISGAEILLSLKIESKMKRSFTRTTSEKPEGPLPSLEEQRIFLTGLLVSPRPDLGFQLLKASGLVAELWPEIAAMDDVDHSKEFHPEGNVWSHTMETFQHRKPVNGGAFDLLLSLGLLFHDIGKPLSQSAGRRRFSGHAEIGEQVTRRFLERLEFDRSLVASVCYLVRNHMLPAALPRLPLSRTGEIISSPLFPVLMELYRCDESSSFKGLDAYYESSAAYQSYLKNRRNPYRSADGKKLNRYTLLS
ncbi:MAG: HD domain-containing protein [Treponema sp.]|jgi:poly(A) polymerase|nr:HD domain-containing protein [Treponema sp.]